jgi:hypothetical protein
MLGLGGFFGFRRMQIVGPAAGVRVQGKIPALLALQRFEAIHQRQMLGDVREIACVIDVLVVHVAALY